MKNIESNTQEIIKLLDKLNQFKIIDKTKLDILKSKESDSNEYSVTIHYSTDMYVLSDKLNYALDDMRGLEIHRLGDIEVVGYIEILFNVEDKLYQLNEIFTQFSLVDMYVGDKIQGESNDWNGYEIDNQFETDNIIDYLNKLIETCEMSE